MKMTEKTFTASGPVFDMLTVFYYLRQLDYEGMAKDSILTATVFSGKEKETVSIRYLGKEMIKLKDKTQREAYRIKFSFSRSGGKKSSEDMETWISTDSSHTPLYLVGKLPVGEIRASLVSGQ